MDQLRWMHSQRQSVYTSLCGLAANVTEAVPFKGATEVMKVKRCRVRASGSSKATTYQLMLWCMPQRRRWHVLSSHPTGCGLVAGDLVHLPRGLQAQAQQKVWWVRASGGHKEGYLSVCACYWHCQATMAGITAPAGRRMMLRRLACKQSNRPHMKRVARLQGSGGEGREGKAKEGNAARKRESASSEPAQGNVGGDCRRASGEREHRIQTSFQPKRKDVVGSGTIRHSPKVWWSGMVPGERAETVGYVISR